jgi:hypothetical protein
LLNPWDMLAALETTLAFAVVGWTLLRLFTREAR